MNINRRVKMPVDPDELKVRRVKREQQIYEIQQYMEEQDAIDQEGATGKMGHHTVKVDVGSEKMSQILDKALNLLKDK
jgi:hypothetical protein